MGAACVLSTRSLYGRGAGGSVPYQGVVPVTPSIGCISWVSRARLTDLECGGGREGAVGWDGSTVLGRKSFLTLEPWCPYWRFQGSADVALGPQLAPCPVSPCSILHPGLMQVGMATVSTDPSAVPEVPVPVYPGGTSLSLSTFSIYGASTVCLPYAGDAMLQ